MTSQDRRNIALLIALVALPVLIVLASGTQLNGNNVDFFSVAASHEFTRQSLLGHGTLPLWSHLFGGGYPTFAHPDDPTLSPVILLTLVFGSVVGLKVIVALVYVTCTISTYVFARLFLRYGPAGAFISALTMASAPWLAHQIKGGNYTEVAIWLTPFCLLLVGLAARGSRAAFCLLPVVFYTMLYDGKLMAILAILFVGLICAVSTLRVARIFPERESRSALLVFASTLVVGILLTAVKILPVVELMQAKGGVNNLQIDFGTHSAGYGPHNFFPYSASALIGEFLGLNLGLATVGPTAALLAAAALFFSFRRAFFWAFLTVALGWLMLAFNAPMDLFVWLREVPGFGTINKPAKYFTAELVFCIAMLAGAAMTWISANARPQFARVVLALAVCGAMYPYAWTVLLNARTYRMPFPALAPGGQYALVQSDGLSRSRTEPIEANQYLNLRRNIGTLDWYNSLLLPERATPAAFVDRSGRYTTNPAYPGEMFFESPENSAAGRIWAGTVVAEANVVNPGLLVVNQNYSREWRTNRGTIEQKDGRLAVRLHEPGRYSVELTYAPRAFYLGGAISLITLLVSGLFALFYVRVRGVPFVTPHRAVEAAPRQVSVSWS